jgi:uncharacterized protein
MTVYFGKTSPANTDTTLNIAKQRASELGIRTILVASTYGDTGVKAAELFQGFKVIVVGHSYGHSREPNETPFTDENRKRIESKGGVVYFGMEALVGVGLTRPGPPPAPGAPAARRLASDLEVGSIVANTLRMFCNGIKVVVECSIMAAAAGLVRTDEDIVAIAGTGRGADTAVVMRAATPQDLFRCRIREILCKPISGYDFGNIGIPGPAGGN